MPMHGISTPSSPDDDDDEDDDDDDDDGDGPPLIKNRPSNSRSYVDGGAGKRVRRKTDDMFVSAAVTTCECESIETKTQSPLTYPYQFYALTGE